MAQKGTGQVGYRVLGIYLNDHLAGATAGTELAHRVARTHRAPGPGGQLKHLAAEVAQDRAALIAMMKALGIPVRAYKVYAAWIGEKAGRVKFNGRLLARSPLSDLEELELLRLGVEGKAAGWRTLRTLAGTGAAVPLSSLAGQRVHAVAGIGNPGRFFAQLAAAGLEVIEHAFPDHHRYRAADLEFPDGLPLLMTEKDAVKCRSFAAANRWYLPVAVSFEAAGGHALLARLQRCLAA